MRPIPVGRERAREPPRSLRLGVFSLEGEKLQERVLGTIEELGLSCALCYASIWSVYLSGEAALARGLFVFHPSSPGATRSERPASSSLLFINPDSASRWSAWSRRRSSSRESLRRPRSASDSFRRLTPDRAASRRRLTPWNSRRCRAGEALSGTSPPAWERLDVTEGTRRFSACGNQYARSRREEKIGLFFLPLLRQTFQKCLAGDTSSERG